MGHDDHQRIRPRDVVTILGKDERSSFLSSKSLAGGLLQISSWYGGIIKWAGWGHMRVQKEAREGKEVVGHILCLLLSLVLGHHMGPALGFVALGK